MKIKRSVPKEHLKQLCDYYGITVDSKATKPEIHKILSEFDEEKFLFQQGNKINVEELSKIKYSSTVDPHYHDGNLYYGNADFSTIQLRILNLETFEEKTLDFNSIPLRDCFDTRLFFEKNQLHGIFPSEDIYRFDLSKNIVFPPRILKDETSEIRDSRIPFEFVQKKGSKLYFSKIIFSYCLFCVDLGTNIKTRIIKRDNELLKFMCVLEQGVLALKGGLFHIFDWKGNSILVESLKHLYFANCYYQEENDLLYISNGRLHNSVVSNEIIVLNSKDLENPLKRYWTSHRINCDSTFVHGEYLYFLKVFNNQTNNKSGFSRTKLVESNSLSSMIKNPTFSDFTILMNEKKFFLHKFILSEFTNLDLSKDEMSLKMTESTFTKAIQFMYDGLIPSLESFEVSELETNLKMKIQNANQFFESYTRMLNASEYYDFVIKFDNETEFKCHKLILSRSSDYFKSLFLGNFDDSKNSEMFIEEISPDHMAWILEYFYVSTFSIDNAELIIDLIETSQFLICEDLIHYLNEKLILSLNDQNVFAILKYSAKEENIVLQNKCLYLIKKNYSVEVLMKLFVNHSEEIFSFSFKNDMKEYDLIEELDSIEPPKKKKK
jgi:hypothetical protein